MLICSIKIYMKPFAKSVAFPTGNSDLKGLKENQIFFVIYTCVEQAV